MRFQPGTLIYGVEIYMKKNIRWVAATVVTALAVVWVAVVAPRLTQLPTTFRYEVEVLSLDNFYQPEAGRYAGEQRSVSRLSWAVVASQSGVRLVDNRFAVRTLLGQPIFSVQRRYAIDPQSRQHVAGFGDRDRGGTLFAPRHLRPGQPFVYWHLNYDGPAHLTFAGEETIFGLRVYRYEADYGGVVIDQTDNLGHLPGVPRDRGVVLDPHLWVWIEPVSGLLVKYRDDTTAYFYDRSSGERLHPWNHFSNVVTRASVQTLVQQAQREKLKLTLVEELVPALLLVVAFAFALGWPRRLGWAVFAAGLVALVAWGWFRFGPPPAPAPVTIGIARWSANPEYTRNLQGFTDALAAAGYRSGREVHYLVENSEGDAQRQRDAISTLVTRRAALIYSLTTPGTLIAKELVADLPIVFSVVLHPVDSGVVESLNRSGNNLVGTRPYVPAEQQLAVFRELVPAVSSIGFLHRAGEPNSVLQLDEMRRAGRPHGIEVVDLAAVDLGAVDELLEQQLGEIDALYSSCDTLIQAGAGDRLTAFAHAHRLPSFACLPSSVTNGDLVATYADFYEIGYLAGEQAALILDGATPTSLETITVQRPLIRLNRATAQTLGIGIPQGLQLRVHSFFP